MTAQAMEILLLEGVEHSLVAQPLEPLLDSLPRRPKLGSTVRSTALYRGYIGSWSINDAVLRLDAVHVEKVAKELDADGWHQFEMHPANLRRVFRRRKLPIPAKWFSGKLRLPLGECLVYSHMAFTSVYEQDRIITIDRGRVVGDRTRDNARRLRWQIGRTPFASGYLSAQREGEEAVTAYFGDRPAPLWWFTEAGLRVLA